MALFAYASSEETTNANRVCRLLLGPCTDQLRDLLRHHVPTSTFPSVINHHRSKLPRLTPHQRNLILPITGCYSGNYDDMDISLLYILLRNICGIPPHINGWGFDPVPTDRTASANIERIRSNRNQCVHSTNPTLTNAEFNLIWSSVRSAVVEIDNYLSNGNTYEKEVDLLRHETMDPVRDKHYREELDRQTKEDQATRDKMNELKRKLSTEQKEVKVKIQKIDNEISSMKSNSFPQNLRDHTRKEIEQHTRESTFVEIEAVRKFIAIHVDKDVFLITGRPGIGKSKNGLDLLRHLGKKHPTYDVVKISDLHLVKHILNKDSKIILLLEDVFGKTNCKYSEDNDKSVLDILHAYINSGNVKVIFTIRSVVKKSLQYLYLFSSHRIFKQLEEIDLDSSQFKMKAFEKTRLLSNYCLANNIRIVEALENENCTHENILDKHVPVRISETTLTNIVNIETYLGFPESCYMFTTNRALTRLGIQFFKHPTRFLNDEIDCLRTNGENNRKERISYITLVYILLSSNALKTNDFDERKVDNILKSCYNQEGFILNSEIVDAAEEMTGSYLTCNAEMSVFQFQHQTIFESIMLSYYKVDPKLVLTTLDFEMIREIVKLCKYHAKKEEIRMVVPKELYGDLARRLYLIFCDQFSHMPSNFIKVMCDSDLMTEIDADFINQLGEHFMEASNYKISTIITYDGKSEEVVFCLLAVLLWYSTIKDWKTDDIKVILHSLKTKLLSETRSNVINACKRSIVAAFLYLCDKKNTNDIIKFFLQTIDELEISFDINRCIQDVVDRQNHPVASCILQHFSKKINIVEVIFETERESLQDLIDIFTASFSCSPVGGSIHDRARLIKWVFSSVNPKHFNMTEAVRTAGDKGLLDIVDWFLEKFNYELFDCKVLLKEAFSKGWEIVVRRFLQEDDWQSFDLRSMLSAACQHSWHQIVKQLLQNSTLVTFDANVLLTDACKKDDFEIVKSLIVYISDKKSNFNDDIQNVFEALQSNKSWSMSDFCANFVQVLLKQIDSDKKLIQNKDLENLNTINLLLDNVPETTFNFPSAIAEAISKYIIYKENILQLFMDSNHINQIHVSLLLLEACREVNSKFVIWLLKNIDNELLKVTTSFNESCTYGRLQIITIMMQYADHKLLNFTSAFLNCVKEEWRHHNEQNEEVLKFLLKTFDHSLLDLNKIAIETIILGQENVMKILLNNIDIQSLETEEIVDVACEQGLLGVVDIFWKSENKEQINLLSAVNRALKGNKLDVVNWFRKHINVGIMNVYVPLDLPIINKNSLAIKLIIYLFENELTFKIYIDKVIDHNRTDLLKWLYSNTNKITSHVNTIITDAIFKGRKDVILWIVQNVDKELIDMKSTAKHLLEFGFLEIVAWILQNVDPKQIAMNEACCNGFLHSLNWMQCNVSDALLNIKTVITVAIYRNNFETVKWMILNNDHKHLDIQKIMHNCCSAMKNEQIFSVLKVIVENVDWERLDMKTVMNIACKFEGLDIVKCILDKADHKLLDINSAMIGVCEAGNLDIVKCILEKVDQTNLNMKSAMIKACEKENVDIVKCILDKADHKLLDINSAMIRACDAGNLDIVKCIFEKVDHTHLDMKMAMINACQEENVDAVKYLLDKVDHKLLDINIAMIGACGAGSINIVKCILEKVDHTQLDMKMAMINACQEENVDTVKYLLDKVDHKLLDINNAMIRACGAGSIDIVKCILEKVDHTQLDMKMAMINACEEENVDTVKYLLDKVDHNLVDFKGVLYEAYDFYHVFDEIESSLRVFKVIVENVDWKRLDMKAVMNIACKLEGLDTVKCFLDIVDHKLLDINSAMIGACDAGNLDIVKCILEKVDHTHLDIKSAMIKACQEENVDTVKCILDKVDHNLIEFKEVLCEFYRQCDDYEDEQITHVFQVILENVDWERLDIKRVMNLACQFECLDIVECILDKEDHTLLDMNSAMIRACETGNTDIIKCILDRVDHEMLDMNSATMQL